MTTVYLVLGAAIAFYCFLVVWDSFNDFSSTRGMTALVVLVTLYMIVILATANQRNIANAEVDKMEEKLEQCQDARGHIDINNYANN